MFEGYGCFSSCILFVLSRTRHHPRNRLFTLEVMLRRVGLLLEGSDLAYFYVNTDEADNR